MKKTTKAEVLIGRRNKCSDGTPMGNFHKPIETPDGWLVPFEWDYQFGLVLDGKVIYASQPCTGDTEYGNLCMIEGQEIRDLIKKHKIMSYELINGRRSRRSNNEIVTCSQIPPDEVKIFKKALTSKARKK